MKYGLMEVNLTDPLATKEESHIFGNMARMRLPTLPPPLKPGHNLPPISEEGEVMWELLILSQVSEV